jgi:hypothetical protein
LDGDQAEVALTMDGEEGAVAAVIQSVLACSGARGWTNGEGGGRRGHRCAWEHWGARVQRNQKGGGGWTRVTKEGAGGGGRGGQCDSSTR